MLVCQACAAAGGHRIFVAREMMFGLRDEFDYFECSECGCVQMSGPPPDLSKYYPHDYYSFQPRDPADAPRAAGRKERFVVRRLTSHHLGRGGVLGRWLVKRHPSNVPPYWLMKKGLGLGLGSKILDVGTGRGELLVELRALGFRRLTGVDPFIASDVSHGRGVKVLKATLDEVRGEFDFVMLHHSFEHMPRPASVLERLHTLVRRGRYVLLRIPLAGTYAWREYGADWVNLDAPRHLCLHTPRSVRILAARAGFEVDEVIYDSTGLQFAGSEQYRRDIPLYDPRSVYVNPEKSIFAPGQLESFEERAAELNEQGDGDMACFYLRKT